MIFMVEDFLRLHNFSLNTLYIEHQQIFLVCAHIAITIPHSVRKIVRSCRCFRVYCSCVILFGIAYHVLAKVIECSFLFVRYVRLAAFPSIFRESALFPIFFTLSWIFCAIFALFSVTSNDMWFITWAVYIRLSFSLFHSSIFSIPFGMCCTYTIHFLRGGGWLLLAFMDFCVSINLIWFFLYICLIRSLSLSLYIFYVHSVQINPWMCSTCMMHCTYIAIADTHFQYRKL